MGVGVYMIHIHNTEKFLMVGAHFFKTNLPSWMNTPSWDNFPRKSSLAVLSYVPFSMPLHLSSTVKYPCSICLLIMIFVSMSKSYPPLKQSLKMSCREWHPFWSPSQGQGHLKYIFLGVQKINHIIWNNFEKWSSIVNEPDI